MQLAVHHNYQFRHSQSRHSRINVQRSFPDAIISTWNSLLRLVLQAFPSSRGLQTFKTRVYHHLRSTRWQWATDCLQFRYASVAQSSTVGHVDPLYLSFSLFLSFYLYLFISLPVPVPIPISIYICTLSLPLFLFLSLSLSLPPPLSLSLSLYLSSAAHTQIESSNVSIGVVGGKVVANK